MRRGVDGSGVPTEKAPEYGPGRARRVVITERTKNPVRQGQPPAEIPTKMLTAD